MTDRTSDQDAASGVEIAQAAIRAIADNNEAEALSQLNRGSHSEVTWAASYLLGALRELALLATDGDGAKASRLLHAGANNDEDAAVTAAMVILDDAMRREGLSDG